MDEEIPSALRDAVHIDPHGVSFQTEQVNPYRGPWVVFAPLFGIVVGVILWATLVFAVKDAAVMTNEAANQLAVASLFGIVPLPTAIWYLLGRFTGASAVRINVVVDANGITISEGEARLVRHPRHRIAHCYAPPDTPAIALHLTEPTETVYLQLDLGYESRQWLANQIKRTIAGAQDEHEISGRGVVERQSAKLRRAASEKGH